MTTAPDAAIHQNTGGKTSAAPPTAAAAGRSGSRSHSTAGTSTRPGSAAITIAIRQPCACATGPLIAELSMMPTGTAIMKIAIARARRARGTRSPIQLVAAGVHTASPIPTPSRVPSSIA